MPVRPPVSVVVPFLGSDGQLDALLVRLRRLRTSPGDELIIADNGALDHPRAPGAAPDPGSGIRLYPAGGVRAPGFARNRGAAVAHAEWLVFIDADTAPEADLLDAYFAPPPGSRTAVLGGGIVDVLPEPADPPLAARHLVARAHMAHQRTLGRPDFPYAQSANCAILRRAFVEVGGFEENVRAAEDADLCFRLRARGWGLEVRPAAMVRHHARSTARQALVQLARHGAGAAWCNRRHPGSFPAPGPIGLASRLGRSALRAGASAASGDREAAAFAAFEVLEASAFEFGRLLPNRARR